MVTQDARSSCAGLSVLVIDDSGDVRDIVRAILEVEGAVVSEAATLEQARALLYNHVPDAIVTDLKLWSEERAGAALLDHVKRRFPPCAVLVFTGRADAYDDLCGIGFDAVLLKPASASALVAALVAAVRRCRRTVNRRSATAA